MEAEPALALGAPARGREARRRRKAEAPRRTEQRHGSHRDSTKDSARARPPRRAARPRPAAVRAARPAQRPAPRPAPRAAPAPGSGRRGPHGGRRRRHRRLGRRPAAHAQPPVDRAPRHAPRRDRGAQRVRAQLQRALEQDRGARGRAPQRELGAARPDRGPALERARCRPPPPGSGWSSPSRARSATSIRGRATPRLPPSACARARSRSAATYVAPVAPVVPVVAPPTEEQIAPADRRGCDRDRDSHRDRGHRARSRRHRHGDQPLRRQLRPPAASRSREPDRPPPGTAVRRLRRAALVRARARGLAAGRPGLRATAPTRAASRPRR